MRKFECDGCGCDCKLETGDELEYMLVCVQGLNCADWREVISAENAQTTQQFGNSEQLPSNPRKFPDWVKVGELGYEPMIGYYKIVNFFNKGKIVQILRFENNTTYAQGIKDFNPYHCEARKRPFNDDEMKALVGKVVEHGNNRYLVTSYLEGGEGIIYLRICESWETEKSIMNNYTINGKPCYKLEHLENGEWVE